MRIFNISTISIFLSLTIANSVYGQYLKETGITSNLLKELKYSLQLTTPDTALMNALTNNELHALTLSREFMKKHNNLFSHKIKTKGITDQQNSGRCWIFAGLNLLRPLVIKKYHLKNFEFSQSYLAFYDKLEKANFILEFIIQTRDRDLLDRELSEILDEGVQDGGYWQWFVALVEKYGLVPKDIYPETHPTSNTWLMNRIINEQVLAGSKALRTLAQKGVDETELRVLKLKILKQVYKTLVMHFTTPPEHFIWRYEDEDGKIVETRTYTPLEFYREFVGINLKDYVSLIHYPGREFNRLYEFDNCRNLYDSPNPQSVNVEITQLKEFVKKSILNDEPVWFACDVGKGSDRKTGILSSALYNYDAIFQPELKMDKETRIFYRYSNANHAMIILGVDIKNNQPVKYLVENSHGSDEGEQGFYTMYDDWFTDYVYEVIINKKYLTDEIKKIFAQEPIHLPLWDPMAQLLKVE